MSPEEPGLRLARAAVFATACIVVSAGGHSFASGASVAPSVLLLGALGAFALAYALSGRERRPEVVLAATVGAQVLLHQLFARTAPVEVTSSEHGHLGVGMTLVHLFAAVLTGWWLHRGESAAWLMLRLWGRAPLPLLRWLLAVSADLPSPVRRAIQVTVPRPPCAWELAAAVHRRGPPARSRAA